MTNSKKKVGIATKNMEIKELEELFKSSTRLNLSIA